MLGIELITTRRRRQLEAAESRLKLRSVRWLIRTLMAEVRDSREIYFECNTVRGILHDQEDKDEIRRLDSLLLEGRVVLSHLGDEDPITEGDIYSGKHA